MSKVKSSIIADEGRADALRGEKEPDLDIVLCELSRAKELMQWFVDRVEKGEVRSRRTYKAFKEFLEQTDG